MKYYKIKQDSNLILDESYEDVSQTIIINGYAYFSVMDADAAEDQWEEITEEEWNRVLQETAFPDTANQPTQQEIINAEMLLNQVELMTMQKKIVSLLNEKGGN